MNDIVRVTHHVTDRAMVEQLAPVLGRQPGCVRPAASMVIADLMPADMLYEVEVMAYPDE